MRFQLTAVTDLTSYAIFDPGALRGVAFDPRCEWVDVRQLEGDCRQGKALLYSWRWEGSTRFAVFVDEEPPAEWRARRYAAVRGALLRVPSGRLCAAGVEQLLPPLGQEAAAAEIDLAGRSIACQSIPPGNYEADAWDLTPDLTRGWSHAGWAWLWRRPFATDAVIVLRRLPDDADLSAMQGGAFGFGYVSERRAGRDAYRPLNAEPQACQ